MCWPLCLTSLRDIELWSLIVKVASGSRPLHARYGCVVSWITYAQLDGLCLLVKEKIEPDHRYNAAQLGVAAASLEDEFEKYALATGARVETAAPHMAQIELWERFSTSQHVIEHLLSPYSFRHRDSG